MAKHKTSSAESSSDTPTFETSLAEVETIVQQLEDGDLDLAESLAKYEGAVKHLKNCHQLLEQAERKVELLTGIDAEGNPLTEAFGGVDASTAERAGTRKRGKTASDSGKLKGLANLDGQSDDSESSGDATSLF